MAKDISTSWNYGGSANLRDFPKANINTQNGSFRVITRITRRDAAWCKCGGTVYTCGIDHRDYLMDTSTSTVIKYSSTEGTTVHGDGPRNSDHVTTTFSNFTRDESNRVVRAWRNGTLRIVRDIWRAWADWPNKAGSPYFRNDSSTSGLYNDTISVYGTNAAYDPTVKLNSFEPAKPEVLYSPTGNAVPFNFSVTAGINGTDYWEGDTVSMRMELRITNLTTGVAPTIASAAAVLNNTKNTTWTLNQSNFTFQRANGGFKRGCRYRISFVLSVGLNASDLMENAYTIAELPALSVPMHFNLNGNGIGVGMYSSNTDPNADGVFDIGWEMNANGGINGVTNYFGSATVGSNAAVRVYNTTRSCWSYIYGEVTAVNGDNVTITSAGVTESVDEVGCAILRTNYAVNQQAVNIYGAEGYSREWAVHNANGEIATGGHWVDGKTIYRRTFVGKVVGANTVLDKDMTLEKVSALIGYGGTIRGTSGNVYPIPYQSYANAGDSVCLALTANGLLLLCGGAWAGMPYTVYVDYTMNSYALASDEGEDNGPEIFGDPGGDDEAMIATTHERAEGDDQTEAV